MPRFSPVSSRAAFAESELEVLEFWRSHRVFARSLEQRRDAPPFVFYEGPPTANGTPGIHHVLARSYKDLFARYREMCGFSVDRKAGWDTHGLPVELEVERSLKISGKRQIEEFGVAEFNRLCKASVGEYIDEWESLTERMGFWLDMEHPYRTYDGSYIESVWWSLKQLWDRDLLYRGYKVAPYCPRCQTSLSSHELSQGYKENTPDPSVYIKFRLEDGDGSTYLLAWTTTPWTLPGNVALAVHPREQYTRVCQGAEDLILASARLSILVGEYEVVEEMPGSALVDLSYQPLFEETRAEGFAYVVLAAPEMVSMDEGTGIVHTSAAYGETDLALCQAAGVTVRHTVGLDGRFLEPSRYAGLRVKDHNGETDARITADLQEMGLVYRAERLTHSYPFCWRCDTALIYYALTSWFIKTTAVKQQLLENNRSVNWQPAHIRDGRMGNWLENLVDWNLSRSRYWGTPLPIWICEEPECEGRRCIGSAEEIGLTAQDDLHKPLLDEITLPCDACGGVMRRVPDVIDCWYDSGSMPFAQHHYPFENRELFEHRHPADFITEALDQTRGWFFSLLAISTLLFDEPAYRNVICLGLVVDRQGKKMSKSRRILVDPMSIFNQFGADATRWYFFSAVSAGSEYRFAPESVQEVVRRFLLTLWNTYSFLVSYAEIDGFDPAAPVPEVAARPTLDRWCMARLAETVDAVRLAMDAYDAPTATRAVEAFVDDLSKWYVRRSRRRFWKGEQAGTSSAANGSNAAAAGAGGATGVMQDEDKRSAYATLYSAVETLARLVAPFMPFASERIYRNLHGYEGDHAPGGAAADSVHLADYPTAPDSWADPELVIEMSRLRRLVEEGLGAREQAKVKVRQPLARATVHGAAFTAELEAIFADELNVKAVAYAGSESAYESVSLDTAITDDLRLEGLIRELSRKVNDLRKQADLALDDRITLHLETDGELARAVDVHREHLMAETLATAMASGRGAVLKAWEGQLGANPVWVGVAR
ncbi:MAG: isoleucine--tRNA ligase [Candidatus Dormibacteria bacterium]